MTAAKFCSEKNSTGFKKNYNRTIALTYIHRGVGSEYSRTVAYERVLVVLNSSRQVTYYPSPPDLPLDDVLDHGVVVAGVPVHEDPGTRHWHRHCTDDPAFT